MDTKIVQLFHSIQIFCPVFFIAMENLFAKNLIALREKKGETQVETASALNLSRSTYANYESELSLPKIDVLGKITGHFGVTVDMLLFSDLTNVHLNTGDKAPKKVQSVQPIVQPSVHLKGKKEANAPGIHQGMPAVVTVDTSGRDNVVFVPVKARAGYLLGYGDGDYISTLPAYSIPGLHGATYRAFEVDGHSMFNTLHDHDVVIAKWATSADFRDDRVFVIVTKTDGMLVKRCIFRDGKIIAKSDNNHKGEYPTIVLELAEVAEIWYVVQRWTRQLSQPGEIFRRVIDLEAKMALLEGRLSTP